MNSRSKGLGSRNALGLFKEQQGSKIGWSVVSSEEESKGDEVFEVTGNGYRLWRTLQATIGILKFPHVIRGATADD